MNLNKQNIPLIIVLTFLFLESIHSSELLTTCNKHDSYIVYTPEEMEAHKAPWKKAISSNPANLQDTSYQMERALLTITGDDADYIGPFNSEVRQID
jgi:hypothetical protein